MQLIVGRIAKPHGVHGEVVVDVRTDDPGARFVAGAVLDTAPITTSSAHPGPRPPADASGASRPAGAPWQVPATLTIVAAKPHSGRYILRFAEVFDRTCAEATRGVLLCVDSAEVPPSADPDEFNDYELVGLAAVDSAGSPLGEIIRIDHAPASDLLVLRQPSGKLSLVPFVKAIVPEVDVAAGRVVVTPPAGLLEL
ncbi:MAG: ribosome maturation factor RimM [Dactylosporangium sp.]|nr:ribosome maturation factor RimM [Dactylosporangium sp.]NNJ63748.1 ribosome maturation factor RimM [Dactylosporangium sp.]